MNRPRQRFVWIVLVAALATGGCGTTTSVDPEAERSYLSDKPVAAHHFFRKVVREGERSHVLNRLHAGLVAMELGDNRVAAQTFDEALLTIETIYGGNEQAKKARGTFTAEDRKVFRGEPYERAMAFYYRGVLYLMEGDYENARASFKSGGLQDTLAEQEEFRQDFALLEFLEGWSSQCNGDRNLAKDAYALAKGNNDGLIVPNADHNLLLLADVGHAPVKTAEGRHKELLKVKGNSRKGIKSARAQINGTAVSLPNGESVLWQATSRGGREVDSVLAGKANFKETAKGTAEAAAMMSSASTALSQMHATQGNYDVARATAGFGAAAGLISVFSQMASDAAKPAADIRQWGNLPEDVLYGTARVEGDGTAEVVRFDNVSSVLRHGGDARCRVVWTRFPETSLTEG